MEVKNNKRVRCVNRKTGAVTHNHAIYAYDKSWQKSTGNYPQPEPKAEDLPQITEVKKETKQDTNAKTTETAKNDGAGNARTTANAGRS